MTFSQPKRREESRRDRHSCPIQFVGKTEPFSIQVSICSAGSGTEACRVLFPASEIRRPFKEMPSDRQMSVQFRREGQNGVGPTGGV